MPPAATATRASSDADAPAPPAIATQAALTVDTDDDDAPADDVDDTDDTDGEHDEANDADNDNDDEDDDEEDEGDGSPTAADALPAVPTVTETDAQWQLELERERLVRSGWLEKRGERRKTWKRRWFVLRATRLAYYKDESEYSPLGLLSLNDIHSVTATRFKSRPLVLAIVTRARTYYLEAPVASELEGWLAAFDEVLRSRPPSAPSVGSLTDNDDHAAAAHDAPAAPASTATSPTAVAANLPDEVSRQIAHRSGWLWRHERRGASSAANSGTAALIMGVGGLLLGAGTRHWRRRWCVVRDDRLVVYKDQREYAPLRIVTLAAALDVLTETRTAHVPDDDTSSSSSSSSSDEHHHRSGKHHDPREALDQTVCFQIVCSGKSYQFGAETREEMVVWVRDWRSFLYISPAAAPST
ncbi:hypothetical protein AMAG_01846 [Allomyces macrogynus ATCC 38327]|uniref:PH domain-containing protein n=1 Tax=Allomyces macrogynus (strain ATCC 38327) TaxID=578462 RepID=A0A0L0S056_ALLM3|nr:hypothetical protein AMAG_01846 [Allomyces macrogynus ATCC 38327]|eukprot:KNE56002.1 hypothetical protein AMAG_01846 [Allomyces macrogynus ATCC 38327]